MVRLRVLLAPAVAALLLAPAFASGAMRYTSPTGSGSACSAVAPCSLATGVNSAAAGDEVRLTADEYYLNTQLLISQPNVTISGPPGRYAPADFRSFIFFRTQADGAPSGFDATTKILVQQDGFTLRRVSVVGRATGAILINSTVANDMVLDRVTVTDNGSLGSVVGQDSIITNSVIRQVSGSFATNVTGSITGSTITSVTGSAVVNTDDYHDPVFGDYCELDVLNTIAVGGIANMSTANGSTACNPAIRVNYSWVPTSGTGGGVSDPGGFITRGSNNLANTPRALDDPLGGVTTLALGSPAINTGCGGSCGTEDLYGRPRPIGAGNDIGATETILPPAVSDVGVIVTGTTSASLAATVNPNGATTTWAFQVRASGSSTWSPLPGASTGDGTADQAVSGTASGLSPDTAYEVRAVGTNSAGEVASTTPRIFRTAAVPATPPAATSVAITSARAVVRSRTVIVTSVVRTSGSGRITQRITTGRTRLTTWCHATRQVGAAGTHVVTCRLGIRGRRALRARPLALALRTTFTPTTGAAASAVRSLSVRRR